ncbi:Hypothetical predicted protein [Mytilus galloprovincialis]|nr:Hypothetical predicted protein [Mytilus galloprovincialis]
MPILLGGDELSVERGEGAQRAKAYGISQEDRLEGFIWKSEDWHVHVISLQVKDAVNSCRDFLRFEQRAYHPCCSECAKYALRGWH